MPQFLPIDDSLSQEDIDKFPTTVDPKFISYLRNEYIMTLREMATLATDDISPDAFVYSQSKLAGRFEFVENLLIILSGD